jgi:hypothetical protein
MLVMHRSLTACATGLLALTLACANTTSQESCAMRETDAERVLQPILAANRPCQQDSDCTRIAFASTCFDACERAINVGSPQKTEKIVR